MNGFSAIDAMSGMMIAPGEHVRLQLAHSDQRSISCRHASVETCSHHRIAHAQVSVWNDGYIGTSIGSCDSPEALARLVESARSLALVPAKPPVIQQAPLEAVVAIDDALVAATTETLAVRANELLEIVARRSHKLVVETLTLSVDTRQTTSLELHTGPRTETTGRLSWAISIMRQQQAGATALFELIGCDDAWERGWTRLRSDVAQLSAQLAGMASMRDVPNGLRVLLTPAAVADLVVPHLLMQLHARRESPCELSPLLSILEAPAAPGFTRTRKRERDRWIVERGVVAAAMTPGGPFGLTIAGGELDDLDALGDVLCIGRFIGSIDPSGRFSGVAKCSWLSVPGQPDALVPELSLSGDLRLLVASIAAMTTGRELVRGEVLCPGILVGDGLHYESITRERTESCL